MIKLRNAEVKGVLEALEELGHSKASARRAAFKIARVTRQVHAQLRDWETVEKEQIRRYVEEWSIPVDQATGTVQVREINTPEKRAAWNALFRELADAEYEYAEVFTYADFTDEVTPEALVKLGPLVNLDVVEETE